MRFAPRLLGVAILLGAVAAFFLYAAVDPAGAGDGYMPRCAFHESTGLYCPGCGSQRAFHQLLQGRLLEALDYNPLAVLLGPVMVFFGAPILWNLVVKNRYAEIRMPAALAVTLAVLVIAFFVTRNLPWFPFSVLAP